ncbi:phosphoribosylformylglycinamidine cyclo-ligase [Candidatus Heimdallarchaeota archaeon]|nr:MAG: phosphoribosylformylglycinamidine cyclo-ligase [Candidatus Gerdarchaeota archaeon]RLI68144.1 MAG: phosphoribosylformylglycinamidine cyclo-ligase [Candidatus Heimdallarchaeota archaeon]RLI70670.1 MAG: phosphoribosylformylglycinamidine cyclo-ligase [Candidatus Gerdarchaeota archaeon]
MNKKKGLTYKDSGVDIFEEGEAIDQIWRLLPKTFQLNPKVKFLPAISHYGGIVDIGMPDKYLVVTVDGVGSKVLIAEMLEKYDTVGIDCIAMNVNDLICVGAEPLVFVDYFAIEQPNSHMAYQITQGLVKGAEQAKMVIIGGETATLPDIIRGVDGKGFDLAGTAIGIVDKNKLLLGDKIQPGDAIFGIASSGLHSNGYSLVRKVLLEKHAITDTVNGISLAEELLRPTAIYVQEVLELIDKVELHGLANITGGAFLKLARLLRQSKEEIGVLLNNLPEPPLIFKLIQSLGNISNKEMYQTLNMGIGFCIIAPPKAFTKIKEICTKYNKTVYQIGKITNKKQITIKLPSETLDYPTNKY